MQTQRVQEALQDVHAHEHAQGDSEPGSEHAIDHDAIGREWHLEAHLQRLLEEDKGQLLVCQRQCPDTQIGSRVGDCSEHVLNGLDDLMDENLAELKLFSMLMAVAARCTSLDIQQLAALR